MKLEIIYWIASASVSIICLIASIVARFAKDSKAKKTALEIAEKAENFVLLLNGAKLCMFDTEDKNNFTAEEKHAYCKTLIIDYCLDHNIDYTQYDLDTVIEYFMEVGNKINARIKQEETKGV